MHTKNGHQRNIDKIKRGYPFFNSWDDIYRWKTQFKHRGDRGNILRQIKFDTVKNFMETIYIS